MVNGRDGKDGEIVVAGRLVKGIFQGHHLLSLRLMEELLLPGSVSPRE